MAAIDYDTLLTMPVTRRGFLAATAAAGASFVKAAAGRKMTMMLECGALGVKADARQTVEYAARFGFETVGANAQFLASLEPGALRDYLGWMKSKGVGFGNGGLSVDFRRGEDEFRKTLAALPAQAAGLQRAGVTRVSTWISPASDELTYLENMRLHARRLREAAGVLEQHGCRLGLEYVGPKTSWTARRFSFVHSMREMRDLIGEIGKPNVGFLLDSWHWYTSEETLADLKTLTPKDIVSIDLNDAPAGIPVQQQMDNTRELPCATGVIDMAGFLNTLNALGCDAPARCEPFNAALRKMAPEDALAATAAAMKKAFALIQA